MTQSFEHSAAMPAWHALSQKRESALAAGAAALVRPGERGRRARPRLEQQLDEAVHACGYHAHRIAEHFGISVRQLQRWFSAQIGSTPRVWLTERRMQEARRRLTGSSSVKEVAYSMGFTQVSQFSRDFKRRFGHQPSAEIARARLQLPPGLSLPSQGTKESKSS